MPLTTSGRGNTSGIQCRRYLPQRRATARSALAKLRHDHDTAQLALADYRAALPLAEAALAATEAEHRAAETEMRNIETQRLARERVGYAHEMDTHLAAFAESYRKYAKVGQDQIALRTGAIDMNSIEHADGLIRIMAALPVAPFRDMRSRHPLAIVGGGPSLAQAEALYWKIPAAEIVKAA